MQHYTFLWQVFGLVLGFGAFISLSHQYRHLKKKYLLWFSLSAIFFLLRTFIFMVDDYSRGSLESIINPYFERTALAGLLFVICISFHLIFQLKALLGIIDKKMSWILVFLWGIVYLFFGGIFIYLIIFKWPPSYWRMIFSYQFLNKAPLISGKIILGALAPLFFYSLYKSKSYNRWTFLFYLMLYLSHMVDLILSTFPPTALITIPLYFLLPNLSYLLILPRVGKIVPADDGGVLKRDRGKNRLVQLYDLNIDESHLVEFLLDGKSNKDIAWEKETTLAAVKHRLHKLYKKCGVGSRWELFALARMEDENEIESH